MYEAPKLERFGTFRELTLDCQKGFATGDPLLPGGGGTNDACRS